MLLEVCLQFANAQPVHPWSPSVGLDSSQCLLAVLPLADLFHQSFGIGRTFVRVLRRGRFGPSLDRAQGFTPTCCRQGQSQLLGSCFLPLAVHESHRLLVAPFTLLAQDRLGLHRLPGCRVGGGALGVTLALASARRPNCTCSFPACSFHNNAPCRRLAKEGMTSSKFTSPSWL